jgi:hypothetical protein
MAPEIIRQEAYSEKADVFSFAIIMWELVTRRDPYPGRTGLALAYSVANEGLRPRIPGYCPREYARLIVRCWDPDQHNRPAFADILDELQTMRSTIRIAQEQRAQAIAAAKIASKKRALPISPTATAGRPPRQLRPFSVAAAAAATATRTTDSDDS